MRRLIVGTLASLLFIYLLLPLSILLLTTPVSSTIARLLDPAIMAALRNSLFTATLATLLVILGGLPLAYGLARLSFPGKAVVEGLTYLPLLLPPVVSGVLLLRAFGPTTPIGNQMAALGLPLSQSFLAIVLAQIFVASPFFLLSAKAGFEGVDRRYEQVSRTLGVGPWGSFFRITLPLARSKVLTGALLTWARAIGEFGATLMVAYYPRTMPVQIWVEFLTGGLENTLPLALLLMLVALVILLVALRVGRLLPGL